LPGELGFTRLVLQWCGAGFAADGHQAATHSPAASSH
jgi:hypothetical protein